MFVNGTMAIIRSGPRLVGAKGILTAAEGERMQFLTDGQQMISSVVTNISVNGGTIVIRTAHSTYVLEVCA